MLFKKIQLKEWNHLMFLDNDERMSFGGIFTFKVNRQFIERGSEKNHLLVFLIVFHSSELEWFFFVCNSSVFSMLWRKTFKDHLKYPFKCAFTMKIVDCLNVLRMIVWYNRNGWCPLDMGKSGACVNFVWILVALHDVFVVQKMKLIW